MIAIADRLKGVEEYYFSTKLIEIKAMNELGKDVINLGIGNPDLPPSSKVLQASVESLQSPYSHGYQSYRGADELRGAMSFWYKKHFGVELNHSTEILPLMGSKEGIMHISMAFLNAGDGVLVPNPGYPTYKSVSKLMQAKIIEYPLKEKDNWAPDFDYLETLDLSSVKMMWVNYPNMPTGARASIELFQKTIDFGQRNNILIINDNPYSFILNENPISIFNTEGADEVAIELNSLSKSHNMAGWRIGMVVGNEFYIKNILKIKSNMDSGTFLPIQKGAIEALNLDDNWYEKVNSTYAIRKKLAHKIFDKLHCTYSKKDVGMFVWAKITCNKNAFEFSDEILAKYNVFITPGSIFGSNGDDYLRISLCTSREKMQEVLKRISL